MKDELIITKMLAYVEKILGYVAGMKYEGVNRKLVWEIISDDLPELKRVLEYCVQEDI